MARVVLIAAVALAVCVAGVASSDVLNFISLGDWGFVDPDQASVSHAMAAASTKYNASFLTALGDNFYTVGVSSDTDPLWQTAYRNIYTQPSLNIPWYVLLGNHDHYLGHGQGEIDYYKNKRDNRWICPSFWYSQQFNIGGKTLQIVMIDTPLLALKAQRECIQEEIMLGTQNHDDLLNYDASMEALEATKNEQLQWLNDTLAASKAHWLIVAGHFPVYSGGEHGNTPEMLKNVKPLLDHYNVDAYLCGHDHTLQHLQDGSVQYYVSGGGTYRGTYKARPQSRFGTIIPGFMVHSVSLTNITTIMIDRDGKEVYRYVQPQRRSFE